MYRLSPRERQEMETQVKELLKFEWSAACQTAFEEVKRALTSAPVLAMPDFTRPFEVICDASGFALGAILMQDGKPICFESRKLIPAEKNYSATERELLGVIHALKVWRCYLEGAEFSVVTDHNPNVFFQTQPNLSGRQARWSEYLQRFQFDWQYRPGRTNPADPLSRDPRLMVSCVQLLTALTRSGAAAAAPETEPKQVGRKRVRFADEQARRPGKRPRTLRQLPEPQPTQPEPLLERIKQGYQHDAWFAKPEHTQSMRFHDGLWWKGAAVAVPNHAKLRLECMEQCHDQMMSGHLGITKTLKSAERVYWWPTLRRDVTRHVQTCHTCQRDKPTNQKPAGLLQPMPIPGRRWESVSMDLITALPRTGAGHDAIIVFVDRLSKMVHFRACTTDVGAEAIAHMFVDNVVKLHGIPRDIVSDRDPRFLSKFWEEVCAQLGVKQLLSTAFHPQTDGQTEPSINNTSINNSINLR
jgi:hypothetical protein